MSVEELMNIQVTSVSRQPEKLYETASAIQVITNEDIRRSGATTIPEALRLADNLIVTQKSSSDWGVTARGFNTDLSNKMLVLIDGRTVYSPLFSGVFWDFQDYLLEDIDHIEVISGPGGVQWGANAVNGVINIITKSAVDTKGFYSEDAVGTEPDNLVGLRYGGDLGSKADYRVYGKYFDAGNELLSTGAEANDAWQHGQLGFRIDARPSANDNLSVHGDYFVGNANEVAEGTSHFAGANILGRWTRTYADGSDMSVQFYYDRSQFAQDEPPFVAGGNTLAPAGIFSDGLDTYDVDFQRRLKIGARQQVIWGLGYRFTHDVVVNAPSVAFFPTTLDQNLASGFAEDHLTLRKNLILTFGTKLEHNDYTGWEVQPSVRLALATAKQQTLWAAISRAVREPSRIDRDLEEPASPHVVVLEGSSSFTSEKVYAYELGYRGQLSRKASASLSTFYNYYTDLRSVSATPVTTLPFYFQNNLEGSTYGLELSGDYRVNNRWRLHLGYDLLKEDIHVKPGETDLNNALNETGDPQNQVFLRSSFNLPHRVELDPELRWIDTVHDNDNGMIGVVPSYFEMGLRVAWKPTKRLELSIVGQNLLQNEHPEFGPPNPTEVFIRRSVYGKVSWSY